MQIHILTAASQNLPGAVLSTNSNNTIHIMKISTTIQITVMICEGYAYRKHVGYIWLYSQYSHCHSAR